MTIMMMTAYRRTYLSKYRLTGRGNFLHQPVGLCKIATVKNFNINVKSETGSKDSHARFSSEFPFKILFYADPHPFFHLIIIIIINK